MAGSYWEDAASWWWWWWCRHGRPWRSNPAPRARRAPTAVVVGHQAGVPPPAAGPGQERERVEVRVAAPQPEVEGFTGETEHLTPLHPLTSTDGHRVQEGVAGAQAVIVEDDDVPCAAHGSREDDEARRGREDGLAGGGVEVDAAVAGRVGRGRRSEAVGDGRVDRRLVRSCRRLDGPLPGGRLPARRLLGDRLLGRPGGGGRRWRHSSGGDDDRCDERDGKDGAKSEWQVGEHSTPRA